MTMEILDPCHEGPPGQHSAGSGNCDPLPLAPRRPSLDGATVGIISNGKEGTATFFGHLAPLLRERYGVARVELRVKSNYSAPAEAHLLEEARHWAAVIAGVGD